MGASVDRYAHKLCRSASRHPDRQNDQRARLRDEGLETLSSEEGAAENKDRRRHEQHQQTLRGQCVETQAPFPAELPTRGMRGKLIHTAPLDERIKNRAAITFHDLSAHDSQRPSAQQICPGPSHPGSIQFQVAEGHLN